MANILCDDELENTYRYFQSLADFCKENKDDLIKQYQVNEDPVILAKIFTNNYRLIIKESSKYYGLSNWDIASCAVEEMHNALMNFDFSRQTAFVTYYFTCFRNRLRTETESINYQKRKANNLGDQFDDINVLGKEPEFIIHLIDAIENNKELTEREKKYCIYVINDTAYTKDKDFSFFEGISDAAVCYIKKSLKNKLNYLVST